MLSANWLAGPAPPGWWRNCSKSVAWRKRIVLKNIKLKHKMGAEGKENKETAKNKT